MGAIISLLAIITISLLLTRVGAVALSLTGLSPEVARFQARSAFTGVGFTTSESETLVNHPVRRRILSLLMFWGNIGIAAIIASTIASFANSSGEHFWSRVLLAVVGILVLWFLFTSQLIDDLISHWVERALLTFTRLQIQDYTSLLRLQNGYVVIEKSVKAEDAVVGVTLGDAKLANGGVLVLGVTRASGDYVGSPNGATRIEVNDTLTIYGPEDRLANLDLTQR